MRYHGTLMSDVTDSFDTISFDVLISLTLVFMLCYFFCFFQAMCRALILMRNRNLISPER